MHDVVAHRVSLMVVHAAALQAVARKDPEKAVRNAALVGDMGRQALTELREMLGVLRTGSGPQVRVPEASPPAAASAVPLAAVGAAAAVAASRAADGAGDAVERARRGRARVWRSWTRWWGSRRRRGWWWSCRWRGTRGRTRREVEQTAYRVVQEALTNVHKHAAGAKTYVRLAHRMAEIAMQVENECPPEAGAAVAGAAAERGERAGGDAGAGVGAGRACSCRGRRTRGVSGCRRSIPA